MNFSISMHTPKTYIYPNVYSVLYIKSQTKNKRKKCLNFLCAVHIRKSFAYFLNLPYILVYAVILCHLHFRHFVCTFTYTGGFLFLKNIFFYSCKHLSCTCCFLLNWREWWANVHRNGKVVECGKHNIKSIPTYLCPHDKYMFSWFLLFFDIWHMLHRTEFHVKERKNETCQPYCFWVFFYMSF